MSFPTNAREPAAVVLRRYVIRNDANYEGWAKIVLGSDGFFAAASDYGDYCYIWGAHGCRDFRVFVIGLANDPGYAVSKLCSGRGLQEYDGDATSNGIRRRILEGRREGSLSRGEARGEWDHFEAHRSGIESTGDSGIVGFYEWAQDTELDEYWSLARYVPNPQCMAFCRKVLPRLAEMLTKELADEANAHAQELAR